MIPVEIVVFPTALPVPANTILIFYNQLTFYLNILIFAVNKNKIIILKKVLEKLNNLKNDFFNKKFLSLKFKIPTLLISIISVTLI